MTAHTQTAHGLVAIPRLTGFETHPHGAVVTLRQELTRDGTGYLRNAWSVATDGSHVAQLTDDEHGVGEVRPAADGSVYFTSTRPVPGAQGSDADTKHSRLWWLPARGEARFLADRPGGFSNLRVAGGRIFALSDVLPSALAESHHVAEPHRVSERDERLATARREAGVTGILYDRAPIRHWDHDLGPGEPTLWFASETALRERRRPGAAPEHAATQQDESARGAAAPDPLAEREGRTGDDDAPAGADADSPWRAVTAPRGVLTTYQPAPDGSGVLLGTETRIDGGWQRSEVWYVPLTDDSVGTPRLVRERSTSEWWEPGPISPDGTRALLLRERLWTAEANLEMSWWVVNLADGEVAEILPTTDHWGEDPQWLDDDTVACTADHRGRGIVLRIECPAGAEPSVHTEAGGDQQRWTYSNLRVAGERLWALRSAIDRPAELVHWRAGHGAQPCAVSGLVPEVRPAGRLEEITAHGEDGTEIRAWLALPDAPEPPEGGTPLLVFVHGGPWASNNAWSWRWNPWPFVAAGYAVLLPDPAISTGYGQHMIDRGQQEYGGAPFTDVMALVAAATERPDIDPVRQALLGGSYGGYMANWVAGHTGSRFRCIVTHASLWDLETMGATTDNTEWREATRGGHAQQYSPHRFVREIEVPMLVIHGDKDYRVPISQGLQLWADLKNDTDVTGHRFLYYPDEGHWILKPGNARVWYETVLAFVGEHVLGEQWRRPVLLG